jgi:hypothetical protein
MQTRVFRFTIWFLVGVILLSAVGAILLERRMKGTFTPTLTGSDGYAIIPETPNLSEPLAAVYWNEKPPFPIQSPENGFILELCDDFLGTPTSCLGPLENPESDVNDFDILDTMVADSAAENVENDDLLSYLKEKKETMTALDAEQSSDSVDTDETSSSRNIEQTSDTVEENTPAEQVLIEVRTKIKCVETILKKAVIEPYNINGQIIGLRITGLDKILVARDLLLKSGDIIREVNGHALNSKKSAFDIFKRERKQPVLKVELLREGEARTLLYYLR